MSHKPKAYNGIKRRQIHRARARVLTEARRKGYVTNATAAKIGKWKQGFYHLNALAAAGLLKHKGYNKWEPVKQKPGRPRLDIF